MLSVKLSRTKTSASVKLAGSLDEHAGKALADLMPQLFRLEVVFDVGGIKAVNSIGFRQWQTFLTELAKSATFEFRRCPPAFLEYAGLLPTTAYAKFISSFEVPYRCDACGLEKSTTFEVDAMCAGDVFETVLCGDCNGMSAPTVTLEDLFGPLVEILLAPRKS